MKQRRYHKWNIIILVLFFLLLVLRFPDLRNEMKYLVIAQETLAKKELFLLSYLGDFYPDKPPLYFWLLMSLLHILPKTFVYMASLFLGSFLPMLGITFCLQKQNKIFHLGEDKFLFFSLLCTPFFMGLSIFLRMDMLMSFFIILSLTLFLDLYFGRKKLSKGNITFFYLSIFFAFFTKGPVGILLPVLVISSFLFLEKKLAFWKDLDYKKGACFLLFGIAVWFFIIAQTKGGTDYILSMLGKQTLGRAIQASHHARPFYFYFSRMILTCFPHGLLYFLGSFHFLKEWSRRSYWSATEKWIFSWTMPGLCFFSLLSGKLDVYLLPIYPGLVFLSLYLIKTYRNKKIIQYYFSYSQKLVLFLYFCCFLGIAYYNSSYSSKRISSYIEKEQISKIYSYHASDFINLKYFHSSLSFEELSFEKINKLPKASYLLVKKSYLSEWKQDYQEIYQSGNYLLVKIL